MQNRKDKIYLLQLQKRYRKARKPEKKIIIEYDGPQHFMVVRFGGMSLYKAKQRFKRQQIIDALDAQFCRENNIILFRISYDQDKQARIEELKKLLERNVPANINS